MVDADLLALPGRRQRPGRRAHARLVHAPGRPQPARVPRRARRGLDPRRHQAARPGRRDHAAAGAPLRRRRRRAVQRHRRAAPRRRLRHRRRPGHRAGRRRAAARPAPTSPACARSSPTTSPTSPRPSSAVVAELGPDVPVLAFAGAPFTVASYLIEGRPSRTYEHTKALLHTDEALWHDVMDRLADDGRDVHRRPAARAGPSAFQLFDSWAGTLSRADYERFVLPHSRRVFAELAERHPGGARASTSASAATTCWRRCASAGPRVIGLDWRTSITAARQRLGADVVVQGNLDPSLVLAGADVGARRRPAGAGRQRRPPRPRVQPRPRRRTRRPTPACWPRSSTSSTPRRGLTRAGDAPASC